MLLIESSQEDRQIDFAWKSGLILFGTIALFIGICIVCAC